MMFYANTDGGYAGEHDVAPAGCTAVSTPPERADQIWDGTAWVPGEPSIDEQLAVIEASFDAKRTALAELLATVMLVDGPDEATRVTELKTAYAAACDEKAAAIDALLFGEL